MTDINRPQNPLDALAQFDPAQLPAPPRRHTSGRRELRAENLARGVTVHARPRTAADKEKAAIAGVSIATLPVRRAEPKRGGMTKKAYKKLRRLQRAETGQSPLDDLQ